MFEIFPDSTATTLELIVKVILNLGLVILLIYAVLAVARRLKLGNFGQLNKQLKLVETLYLSPKQKIHLVRIGKKALLLGATDDHLTVLKDEVDVDLPDTAPAVEISPIEGDPLAHPASLKALWERWLASLNPRINQMRHHTGE